MYCNAGRNAAGDRSGNCTMATGSRSQDFAGGGGCVEGSRAMGRYREGRRSLNRSLPSGRRLLSAAAGSMSANTTSSRSGEAMARTLPHGSTTCDSPAPHKNRLGILVTALNSSSISAGTRGPILLAATTNTLFSAARTGMCRLDSSGAKELTLLHNTWAPRNAR